MEKTVNHKAWFLVLPMLLLVLFSAVIPLMTVVNYSVQDTFGNNEFFWAGLEWFEEILTSERVHNALGRQLLFSGIILADRGAAGHFGGALHAQARLLGVAMPGAHGAAAARSPGMSSARSGRSSAASISACWATRSMRLGINYNYTSDPLAAWITVIVMDVWHWTSLVALLCLRRFAVDPRCLLPGRQDRPGVAAGRCSATSSCRKCAACC